MKIKALAPWYGSKRQLAPIVVEELGEHRSYVDPPYFRDTRKSGGGDTYVHEFTADDHGRLAELLRSFRRVRVVVSYYDDLRLEELYLAYGWRQRAVSIVQNLATAGEKGKAGKRIKEILLFNGPSFAERSLLDYG